MTLPAGDAGEIVVQGDHVLRGYLHGAGDARAKFRVGDDVWPGAMRATSTRGADSGCWARRRLRIVDDRGTIYPFAVECREADRRRRGPRCPARGARVAVVQPRIAAPPWTSRGSRRRRRGHRWTTCYRCGGSGRQTHNAENRYPALAPGCSHASERRPVDERRGASACSRRAADSRGRSAQRRRDVGHERRASRNVTCAACGTCTAGRTRPAWDSPGGDRLPPRRQRARTDAARRCDRRWKLLGVSDDVRRQLPGVGRRRRRRRRRRARLTHTPGTSRTSSAPRGCWWGTPGRCACRACSRAAYYAAGDDGGGVVASYTRGCQDLGGRGCVHGSSTRA